MMLDLEFRAESFLEAGIDSADRKRLELKWKASVPASGSGFLWAKEIQGPLQGTWEGLTQRELRPRKSNLAWYPKSSSRELPAGGGVWEALTSPGPKRMPMVGTTCYRGDARRQDLVLNSRQLSCPCLSFLSSTSSFLLASFLFIQFLLCSLLMHGKMFYWINRAVALRVAHRRRLCVWDRWEETFITTPESFIQRCVDSHCHSLPCEKP